MKVRLILGILFLGVLLCGCGREDAVLENSISKETMEAEALGQTGNEPVYAAEMFTERDQRMDYEEAGSAQIWLKGDTAEADAAGVVIDGTTVTITKEGIYVVSGELRDGTLIVDTSDKEKVQLVLNNATIHNETCAAIYVKRADKVFVTLAENSKNVISNGSGFEAVDDNNVDGVLFSKQDITINGLGSLQVTSPVGNGIVAKDDLVVIGADLDITAAFHALDANDSVRMKEATIIIQAGKDGIHGENTEDASLGYVYLENTTLAMETEGDGISAGSYLQIAGGTIEITVGGGSENGTKQSSDNWGGLPGGNHGGPGRHDTSGSETLEDSTSMKGLKAVENILISAGNFRIDSADDAIHSDKEVTIRGGSFMIASGDDAIHAEETLTITGGDIQISESYEGLEALHMVVEGGNISLIASDDGLNAAGGVDTSGTNGGRDGMFSGMGKPGMPGGGRQNGSGGGMHGDGETVNGSIVISGGNINIQASGDGIDANGSLEITGGYVVVTGPTRGDTSVLDYDTSAVITGGTFMGTGASGMMAQSFSDAAQGVIAVSLGSQAAGTIITLQDLAGNQVLYHIPQLDYQVLIFSSPQLTKGENYTLTIGEASAEVEVY